MRHRVVWRKTDRGWIRAEAWLAPKEHLYGEPTPPIYPLSALPMVVILSISALILFPSKPTFQDRRDRDQP
ncbi:hypothetical protein [Blastopirellula marina]|uniref:Uncharacterized protein n=1 Tax=Blastopirellula marina TaxID=124 RepID=A0A2S8GQ32_9BACT|nr:hypothetical protein [Blastopirellula marina]PQO46539.1 hypothetical protein C5Y93_08685 [Blastopirellula marina]